jgi:hypothetical protein
MATQKKPKPAATFRSGSIKAVVWSNDGQNGPFHSLDISRPYRDAQGQWRNSRSFGMNDCDAVQLLTTQAKAWMAQHAAR